MVHSTDEHLQSLTPAFIHTRMDQGADLLLTALSIWPSYYVRWPSNRLIHPGESSYSSSHPASIAYFNHSLILASSWHSCEGFTITPVVNKSFKMIGSLSFYQTIIFFFFTLAIVPKRNETPGCGVPQVSSLGPLLFFLDTGKPFTWLVSDIYMFPFNWKISFVFISFQTLAELHRFIF